MQSAGSSAQRKPTQSLAKLRTAIPGAYLNFLLQSHGDFFCSTVLIVCVCLNVVVGLDGIGSLLPIDDHRFHAGSEAGEWSAVVSNDRCRQKSITHGELAFNFFRRYSRSSVLTILLHSPSVGVPITYTGGGRGECLCLSFLATEAVGGVCGVKL